MSLFVLFTIRSVRRTSRDRGRQRTRHARTQPSARLVRETQAHRPIGSRATPVERWCAHARRRRGRGAVTNATGRFEAEQRESESTTAGSRSTNCTPFRPRSRSSRPADDHHPQRVARHLLRSLDQSLSRLRARLRLLLRAADPRLSWACRPGSISRRGCSSRRAPPTLLERELGGAGLPAAARSRSAPTPTPISRSSGSTAVMRSDARGAGARQPSRRHRHQIGAGDARHRHPRPDGRARGSSRWRSRSRRSTRSWRAPWSRAPRRRRSGSRRSGSWPRPAFRPP